MRNIRIKILLAFLCFGPILGSSQKFKSKEDSLIALLKTAGDDSTHVNILNDLAWTICLKGNFTKSDSLAKIALQLSDKIGFKKGTAGAYKIIGYVNYYEGNYTEAMKNQLACLKIDTDIGYKFGICGAYNSIGLIYQIQGNNPEALRNYLLALKLAEELGNKERLGAIYANTGVAYEAIGDHKEALKNDSISLKYQIANKNRQGIASAYGNMGLVYFGLNDYPNALKNQELSLQINKEIGNREGMGDNYINIASVYFNQGNYAEALRNDSIGLAIAQEIGNSINVSAIYTNIGIIYDKQKKYDLSKEWLEKGLKMAKELGAKDIEEDTYLELSRLDSSTGEYNSAYGDYKSYVLFKDSITSDENSKKMLSEQMTFGFERERAVEKTRHDAELKKQRIIIYSVLGGLLLVIILAITIFRSLKIVNREKKRSDELLLNILPEEVAEELKEKGSADAKAFDDVTVMFTDFKGFTTIAENLSAKELVAEIDYCFKGFDNIINKYNIEKIKTIGDSYMAAGGLPIPNKTHAKDVVNAALEIVIFMEAHKQQRLKEGKPVFEIRAGINTGSVVAGIVGTKKFAYDIWGDTVNLASRMESSGEPGKVNISGSTYELVKNDFKCIHRGKIQAKNKGEVDMYFVS